MSTKTQPNSYETGLALAEKGCHKEALVHFKKYIHENPNDAEAISDLGAVEYCLGQNESGIEHFEKSIEIEPEYPQAYWNLTEAYLACKQPQQASRLFEKMQKMEILNPDIINRTANAFLEAGDTGSAVEMMLMSIKDFNSGQALQPMIDIIRGKRPKIAFFGINENDGFFNFASERFMTVSFSGKDSQELADIIQWSDIAWFDNCDETLSRTLALPAVSKIVVRIKDFQACSRQLGGHGIGKIDKLIVSAGNIENPALLKLQSAGKLVNIPENCGNSRLNEILLELEKEQTMN